MDEQDRYRDQDPEDLYSIREEDAYARGDETESRGADEPPMRQEQGGQGYGHGPRGYQDEPGFGDEEYSSDIDGMHDEDELYGDQLDDLHDRDDETGEDR
ncbi:hypothetical protein F8568_014305 [Actinomadura sp. LD22]|uniref:DUF5709 domain-containing protein n=1 Tax=Actinomadura physcomitrii TaxID=2650748 RepID=A0A6I4MFV9_9ACTN|nr:hypothetical protein [Actinomadura physcomitrii]MWA01529.1 hypothetical protein [Actinomadura physcomitrii]